MMPRPHSTSAPGPGHGLAPRCCMCRPPIALRCCWRAGHTNARCRSVPWPRPHALHVLSGATPLARSRACGH
eukprot:8213361-Pyramimonas_sp.AAC.1